MLFIIKDIFEIRNANNSENKKIIRSGEYKINNGCTALEEKYIILSEIFMIYLNNY